MTYTQQGREIAVPEEAQAHKSRVGVGAIVALFGAGLLLVFVLQNTKSVDVDFLSWTFAWPLWFLIAVSAVLGAMASYGVGVVRRHRRRAASES